MCIRDRHRLRDPQLHQDERGEQRDRGDEQPDDGHGAPRVLVAAPGERQDHAGRAEGDQGDAAVVDERAGVRPYRGNGSRRDDEDDDRDRNIDVERPAPAQVVGEQAAQRGPDDRGDAEDGAQRTLVAPAIPQRDDVGDQRHRGHHQPAAADPLDRPRADQHHHVLRDAAEHRAADEDEHADLEDRLAAEQVAELAGQHRGDRLGQQVGRDDPGHVPGAAEIRDDGRQCRRDDRLVQSGEQQAEQDRREDDVRLAPTRHRGRVTAGHAASLPVFRAGLPLFPRSKLS